MVRTDGDREDPNATDLGCCERRIRQDSLPVTFDHEPGEDVNARSNDGRTALMDAAGSGQIEIVNMLIAAHANVNAWSKDGNTALTTAAGIDCVRALITAHADVNVKDINGFTPLMHAASTGNFSVVNALIAAGANLNATAFGEMTPLNMAQSHPDVAAILRAAGAKK